MGEFVSILCNLYLIFLTAVLTLYTGGTYWQLGDTKYILFRNVTLVCLGAWLAVSLLRGALNLLGRVRGAAGSFPGSGAAGNGILRGFAGNGSGNGSAGNKSVGGVAGYLSKLSMTDFCMLAYGAAVLVSALGSPYDVVPWLGYKEWYMGAVSLCMFVGIYFFVSRAYDGSNYPIYLGEAALTAVFLVGFANRLGFDPVHLMTPFNLKSWEYSHMISTIGNINWFCGFCSVMLGFPVAGYLESEGKPKTPLLYILSVMGLTLLCIQGSDAGLLVAAACIGVCLLYGLRDRRIFRRSLAMVAGMCLTVAVYARTVIILGEEAAAAVPADGIGFERMAWGGWWLIGAAFLLLAFIFGKLTQKAAKTAGGLLVLLGGLAVAAVAVAYATRLPAGDGWGSGRGGLWRFAWQGFAQGGFRQKLLGAGPDCFAPYIYSTLPTSGLTPKEGFWTGTIYANAHNEWLNTLIDLGLLGTAAFAAVFACSIRRYRKFLPGMLVIAMYGVNSLISFQQVLSTPFLFMALGLCEYHMRGESLPRKGRSMEETEPG